MVDDGGGERGGLCTLRTNTFPLSGQKIRLRALRDSGFSLRGMFTPSGRLRALEGGPPNTGSCPGRVCRSSWLEGGHSADMSSLSLFPTSLLSRIPFPNRYKTYLQLLTSEHPTLSHIHHCLSVIIIGETLGVGSQK
jgi:hypothetical protein